ncbi:TRAFAC clade GTPase domain-containing protein [Amycolatopsis sp. CB00013]|uniref:TRAFAC clade GTPase domain-containing protein n=1 Tax=Amycolatopsis sp. CB00013 TaxID=1703945 RepID=UPI00093C87F3|nr:hypothetical protein [Amycolatopsis sp. CB00013]OKJ95663.1 hypothetical protein AMK34_21910 [Amycolatopsis sp. CB00013]
MTTTFGPGRLVRCPICADDFRWPQGPTVAVFDEIANDYSPVDLTRLSAARRTDTIRNSYRQCPNPSGDSKPHFLPATYADHGDPLVIGMVGAPASGKTHLLTAMIRQAYLGGLKAHGVTASALDFRRHELFRKNFIAQFERGAALPGSRPGSIETDILLLRGSGGARPVTFFDVSGEDLESTEVQNRATRFLLAATAVIFVQASEDPPDAKGPHAVSENRSFELAIERLHGLSGNGAGIAVAMAVTKSDRLRYLPPADRWLRRNDDSTLNAADIRAESRDAYAYLQHIGAESSLKPYEAFARCALHFVSASGGEALPVQFDDHTKMYFPHGVRPARVLAPLTSILAMTGVISGPEAQKVGLP